MRSPCSIAAVLLLCACSRPSETIHSNSNEPQPEPTVTVSATKDSAAVADSPRDESTAGNSTTAKATVKAAASPPKEPIAKPPVMPSLEEIEEESRSSAFDSNAWNSAVGLGGGAAGRYPSRGGDRYAAFKTHGLTMTADQPLSTFSVDVDTASYANVRRLLRESHLPTPHAVRIEELINYFRYNDVPTDDRLPFGIKSEVAASPWSPHKQILRVTLRTKDIDLKDVGPRNLVFLVDTSGSMSRRDRLPLLKKSLRLLITTLRPVDRVAIVTYAGQAGIALEPTSGAESNKILAVLDNLGSGGSTHGSAGITTAYNLVRQHFDKAGTNRVILATDGDFNVGLADRDALTKLIEKERESGAFLSVLGFGRGNLRDDFMERIADRGNGNYSDIDSVAEARKVLVSEAGGTLLTVAKDVKLQIEFNPRFVRSYRQLGYENRKLAARDFNDDKVDAGEVGAGHQVTVLYEITPADAPLEQPAIDKLKYQVEAPKKALSIDDASQAELCTVKVRYKSPNRSEPNGDISKLMTHTVAHTSTLVEPSDELKFALAVTGFGRLLRDPKATESLSWDQVLELARSGKGTDVHGYRSEFIRLAQMAKDLTGV